MQPLESKLRDSLQGGALVGRRMHPLARHMLKTVRTRPIYLKTPAPAS